jgi:V/A-type H+-transporting ATPase subunit I
VALLVERRYKGALDQLKQELDKITHGQCEIVTSDVDEDTTAAIVVFSRVHGEAVHKFLAMENVNQIRLPSDLQDMPYDAAYEALRERRKELPEQLKKVSEELKAMSERWQLKLATIRDVLIDRTQEIDAVHMFGRTNYAFVITGWMPVKDLPRLRNEMASRWGEDIVITQMEIAEDEYGDTPVALENPKVIQPFQKLLGVYGMPRYGTVDPTVMLFLFYPLFFGMIVGDVGYGLIMLSIVLWLRFKFRENPVIQIATSILGPAATMVVAFGFVYGELLGSLLAEPYAEFVGGLTGGILPFQRSHDEVVIPFMYVALATGVVHVLLGLTMGIINAVRTKSRKHLYEKGGILVFIVAILIAMAITVALRDFGTWAVWGQAVFAVIAAGGFVFAVRGGGVMGVVETMESVAHIASYLRIMAVGLAGAIFAEAVNEIVAGTVNVVLAAIIGILLHGLNFIIASFSPTIHALRLNFLEFFGKFYETGNRQYQPFTKTGGE